MLLFVTKIINIAIKFKNMKNLTNIILLLTTISISAQLSFDLEKSNIKWTGKEITTKSHFGSLKLLKASIDFKDDIIVGGEFVVDMNSLDVEDLEGQWKERLEGHLRSDDFFSIEKYPKSSLIITNSKKISDNEFQLIGNLTIKEITKPIEFTIVISEEAYHADLTFDRSDYNVKFRSGTFFENLGDKLIFDDIELKVTLNK